MPCAGNILLLVLHSNSMKYLMLSEDHSQLCLWTLVVHQRLAEKKIFRLELREDSHRDFHRSSFLEAQHDDASTDMSEPCSDSFPFPSLDRQCLRRCLVAVQMRVPEGG